MGSSGWLSAQRIDTTRLTLDPLREDDADEMSAVLADHSLHDYIGGRPATALELRDRYRRQAVGHSPDGTEGWLNWIVRDRETGAAIGTVQATLSTVGGVSGAEIAWVVGTAFQGRGFASEAVAAMVGWLHAHDHEDLSALIHPAHSASMAVARRVGLTPTGDIVDGEVRWTEQREP